MKTSSRWRVAALCSVITALAGPLVLAQTGATSGAAETPATGTQSSTSATANADAGGASASDAASADGATPDASTIVTSGAPAAATPTVAPVVFQASATAATSTTDTTGGRAQPPPPPAPTAEQLTALHLLEGEVDGFMQRGEAFRQTVNGLLRHEHDSRVARLRQGFQRQIDSEHSAESDARRHAIEVFENFITQYPNDTAETPDVMFRLAELYYDEAQTQKLENDARNDQLRAQREAAGQTTDDIVSPAVDYRCSVLLYRHIVQRFPQFRLRDTTHYLLGWVLNEMNHLEESIGAYRALVCPARYHYLPVLDLAAPLAGTTVATPLTCARVAAVIQPYGAALVSPAPVPGGETGLINSSLVDTAPATQTEPQGVPNDYATCVPMNGSNGQISRYSAEVWHYIGNYHFDANPPGKADLSLAYGVAAYESSMRTSEMPRVVRAAAARGDAGVSATAAATASSANVSSTGSGVTSANSPGRTQFRDDTEYGPFWSKSLYKIGWSYFRMINGYPRALQGFSRLLDYYDYVGAEEAAQGSRTDTIKWIGVIFSEQHWDDAPNSDSVECQHLVNEIAHPSPDPTGQRLPFECAGIIRIVSPFSVEAVSAATTQPDVAVRVTPQPGRATFIPQDRPWTPEAYLELGNDFFQQTKYYEAITVYRLFLRLYPLHFMAPRVTEKIAQAYERQRQFDRGLEAREGLGRYVEGSTWYNVNGDHPDAQRAAEIAARNSLYQAALLHHQQASQIRNRASTFAHCARGENGGDLCRAARPGSREATAAAQTAESEMVRARAEYGLAVQAYDGFIRVYPNDDETYELKYNRADALWWADRFGDAATAYAEVRDSNENGTHTAAAAFMAVKAGEKQLVALVQAGSLDPCLAVRAGIDPALLVNATNGSPLIAAGDAATCVDAPHSPVAAGATPPENGGPILALNVPPPVIALMTARDAYAARVPASMDNARGLADVLGSNDNAANQPPFVTKFAFLNARTLYRFGHVDQAEPMLTRLYHDACTTDAVIAQAAFLMLRNLYLAQGRNDRVLALAHEQETRTCAGVDATLVHGDIQNEQFRQALAIFNRAKDATGEESLRLYEQSANAMLAAVNANRTHPDAPLALYFTALAYERTNRFDTATQTYMRITQEYNNLNVIGSTPPRELQGTARQERASQLEQSNFRAAVNLERTFDYDAAIRYYGNVVSDQRFANATDHAAHVHTALQSIAIIQFNLGRWTQARDALTAFMPQAAEGREKATVRYRIAEIPFRAQNWAEAVRSLRDYRRTVAITGDTAEFHVQAQYNIATALKNSGDTAGATRELRAVAQVFRDSHQAPGSRAASFAAEALYRDLDTRTAAFGQRVLTQGTGDQLAAQIAAINAELSQIDTQAEEIVSLQGGEYTIGALVARGLAHEHLAEQQARVATLFQFDAAQQRSFAQVAAQVANLRHAADQLDAVGRGEQATQIRDRAQQIEDELQQRKDALTANIQQTYDTQATANRTLAMQDYVIAVHLARRNHVPTQFSATALEHIRIEENAAVLDAAVHALSPTVVAAVQFQYTPGMFNTEAPGLDALQDQAIATPGLTNE